MRFSPNTFLIVSACVFGLVLAGCRRNRQGAPSGDAGSSRDDSPVALDPEPPVVYPASLYQQGIEGTVQLRLFVDEKGVVAPESTHVAESSGYAEFDSAAVAGVPRMHFAPAQRDGRPVPVTFTQPVHFRRPAAREATP
ncbi:MAG: energy transducer TonB [Gemmatimonadota bacterium]